MIRYNLKELVIKKEFEEGRQITMSEVSEKTGISRTTLYRMTKPLGSFSTKTEYIAKLCIYFQCKPNDIMEIIFPGDSEKSAHA